MLAYRNCISSLHSWFLICDTCSISLVFTLFAMHKLFFVPSVMHSTVFALSVIHPNVFCPLCDIKTVFCPLCDTHNCFLPSLWHIQLFLPFPWYMFYTHLFFPSLCGGRWETWEATVCEWTTPRSSIRMDGIITRVRLISWGHIKQLTVNLQ